jgi:diadenosine tetraphosphate (Ap4A) HIT family hydrolase
MTLIDGCIFCKIIRGTIPCHKVAETAKTLAFLDINPLSEGHVLIIPKYHGERLHLVPDEHLIDLLPIARNIAHKTFGERGVDYNLLQNNGRIAHQDVDHVHFHLIPKRSAEEGLGIKWKTRTISQEELGKIAAEIRAKLE